MYFNSNINSIYLFTDGYNLNLNSNSINFYTGGCNLNLKSYSIQIVIQLTFIQVGPLWGKIKEFVNVVFVPYGRSEVEQKLINMQTFIAILQVILKHWNNRGGNVKKFSISKVTSFNVRRNIHQRNCFYSDVERWSRQCEFRMSTSREARVSGLYCKCILLKF